MPRRPTLQPPARPACYDALGKMDAGGLQNVDHSLCYCRSLRLASKRLLALYRDALAPCGLQPLSYALLAAIADRDTAALHDLGDELQLDRSSLRYRLQPLLAAALVATEADPDDRRGRRVRLTAAGRRKLAEAAPLWRAAQARFESAMGGRAADVLRGGARTVASSQFADVFSRSIESRG